MNHRRRSPFPIRVAAALLLPLGFATGQDPTEEIKELARRIAEQMQEIDRLLLESTRASGGQGEAPKALLKRTRTESEQVEQTIDQLIDKLNEMKNQGGGSGSPDDSDQSQQGQDQQQQQQGGQQDGQQGQQRNRREGSTPDFVQQGPEGQDGQQQQQDPGQGQPLGGHDTPTDGENAPGLRPPDDGTGPGQPGDGEGEWGELPPYENFLKNRGSPPRVQEKYRKFWEAYLKARTDKKQ